MSDAKLLLKAESMKKSGWLAAFLNLVLPSAGYFYCGNFVLGAIVLILFVVVLVYTYGIGWLVFAPIVFIDGFLAAGRYNKKMIQALLRKEEERARAEAPQGSGIQG